MQPHVLQVKLNGCLHQLTRLFKRGRGRDAIPEGRARQHCSRSRCMRTEQSISLLQPGLFQYRRPVFLIQVNGWMACNRYGSRLDWMMILPVTAAGTYHSQSVRLDKPDTSLTFTSVTIIMSSLTGSGMLAFEDELKRGGSRLKRQS